MNLKIAEFKISIENYISLTDLPPEVTRLVLKEIYEDIEKKANAAITAELNEREEACKSAKSSGSKAISSETLG